MAPVLASLLLLAVAGGLLRAGLPVAQNALVGQAAAQHAALMICAFFGAVVGIERAVALKRRAAFAVPLLALLGGVALLAGWPQAGALAFAAAALGFVAVNLAIVQKQAAPHTILLLVSALAWLTGCVRLALGLHDDAMLAAWFAFLVITIAAERLEMTRLMRRRAAAQPLLVALLCALLAGAALSGALFGLALLGLALWLAAFDIARRTVRAQGLTRYMALCLLGGYAWLALAGVAWAGMALGFDTRDAALHALGLGFIFCMVMGHAPVILPAVARIKVQFDAAFYLPLALLHASLALRLVDPAWRGAGAALNAAAIALFALVMGRAAWRWRAMELKRERT
ncbi:hypothetical protein HHL10_09680 [Azohydromonas sp. G-1-1-14]|uniref:Uncharacterized protein n=1 Tax=Azohydromonas caseinilytica TaxID=2728836 RepID=A0A848F7U4_9BURK|nr:hypothetical protein [Azohydromonas caseinilytica]